MPSGARRKREISDCLKYRRASGGVLVVPHHQWLQSLHDQLTFVNQHEAQVIACRVFLVHFAESWRKVETAQEKTDGNRLATGWGPVHDLIGAGQTVCRRVVGIACTYLKPHQGFTLVVLIWCNACRLPPDNTQLHMLDFQPDQQEIYPPYNHIFQVVFALTILKLYVQAVLNTDVHLDTAVYLWRNAVAVNPDILFANNILNAAGDCGADKVSQLDINAIVRLVLLFDILEVKSECLGML